MVLAQKQTHRSTNKPESPEVNPHFYGQLIYDKGGKALQWRTVSSVSGAGKVTCKK